MDQSDRNLNLPEENSEVALGRRELLKALAAGGGVIAVSTVLPGQWLKPVIEAGLLPVHAVSSARPPSTSTPTPITTTTATPTSTTKPTCALIGSQISSVTNCDYSDPTNPYRSFTITSASFNSPTPGTPVSFAVATTNGIVATPSSGNTTTDGSGIAAFNQDITLTSIPSGGGQISVTFTISDNGGCGGTVTTTPVTFSVSNCPPPQCTAITPDWENEVDGVSPIVVLECSGGDFPIGYLVIQSAQVSYSPALPSSGTVTLTVTSSDSDAISVTPLSISGTMDSSGQVTTFTPSNSFTLTVGSGYDPFSSPPTVTAAFAFDGSACGAEVQVTLSGASGC